MNNGYPMHFIFQTIFQRLKALISTKNNDVSMLSQPLSSLTPTPFFTIPFSLSFPRGFISNIKNYTNRRLAYTVNNKLKSFIRLHKDPLPELHHSNVIYKISCLDCDASYRRVGQTKRKLITRIKEHRSDINKISGSLSVVSLHRMEGHEFDWANISILEEEPGYKKKLIAEMLYISNQNHSINIQSDTEFLDKIYLPIIKKISH